MVTKNEIILTLCLFTFSSCLVFSQIQNGYFINDKKVRLREAPSLESKIIRHLDEKEKVIYLSSVDLYDGSEYKWVNIKTSIDQGWVYGEFLSGSPIKKKSFIDVEEAGIKINNVDTILSGMPESNAIKILGKPLSKVYDEEYNEDTLAFGHGSNEDLILLVHKYNQRLHHIIIKSPVYALTNDVKIGMNISEIDNSNVIKGQENRYNYILQNKLRASVYDSVAIIKTNEKGIIQEIQIGLPQP